jgi:ferritin-like protein
MASVGYHEPLELLSESTKNLHRAIVSLMEELEAIDWYSQRADACSDTQLKDVLTHNKNEEIEHASMVLEWIRRNSPKFDEMLRKYLFSSEPVTEIETDGTGADQRAAQATLGLGSMRGR